MNCIPLFKTQGYSLNYDFKGCKMIHLAALSCMPVMAKKGFSIW